MADIIPSIFAYDQAIGGVNFNTDSLKCVFYTDDYTSATIMDAVDYDSFSLSGYEISAGSGYTSGGIDVTGNAVARNSATDKAVYDIDDIELAVSGGDFGPVRYAGIYNTTNTNNFVYFFDFGENKTVDDGANFKIKIDANGLMDAGQ